MSNQKEDQNKLKIVIRILIIIIIKTVFGIFAILTILIMTIVRIIINMFIIVIARPYKINWSKTDKNKGGSGVRSGQSQKYTR